ncbi:MULTISPECIES: hypothetical protein [unclassified Bradyrhizobium]
MLQRIDAEGVFHLEDGELAVKSVGLHQELAALAEEARARAGVVKCCIVEIAADSLRGRMIHGVAMLRRLPESCLRLVATHTGIAAGKSQLDRLRRLDENLGCLEPKQCSGDRNSKRANDPPLHGAVGGQRLQGGPIRLGCPSLADLVAPAVLSRPWCHVPLTAPAVRRYLA